jgi:hypothetical protein
MKEDKLLTEYFQSEIDSVEIPPMPAIVSGKATDEPTIYWQEALMSLALAAVIVITMLLDDSELNEIEKGINLLAEQANIALANPENQKALIDGFRIFTEKSDGNH